MEIKQLLQFASFFVGDEEIHEICQLLFVYTVYIYNIQYTYIYICIYNNYNIIHHIIYACTYSTTKTMNNQL